MAGKGGRIPGAGRPKGSRNKRTAELIAEVEASGETPLDYMLRVMRDDAVDKLRRDDMAKAAGPYIHARLSAMEVKADVDVTNTIEVTNDMRWKAIQAALDKVAK